MTRIFVTMLCLWGFAVPASAGQAGASFDRSQWIWSWPDPGSNSTQSMSQGCAFFRVDLTLPRRCVGRQGGLGSGRR